MLCSQSFKILVAGLVFFMAHNASADTVKGVSTTVKNKASTSSPPEKKKTQSADVKAAQSDDARAGLKLEAPAKHLKRNLGSHGQSALARDRILKNS